MFVNKTIYALNSAAVGDLLAAAPVVKWAIDRYHFRTDYRVAVFPEFRDFYPFVSDEKIMDLAPTYDATEFVIRKLNMDGSKDKGVIRLTPSRFKLVEYAAIGLTSRIIPAEELKYVPLKEVPVSHFNIDFKRAVVFITTYRDTTRAWLGQSIEDTARHVMSKGFVPVFVGKKSAISIWKNAPSSDFNYPGFGIDLVDKTSFLELATIMKKSRAVLGMDSGPLHLAFTTDTPVVAGFTNIAPHFRVPVRNTGVKTINLVPNLWCRYCQSNWSLDRWDFAKCPRGQENPECVKQLGGELFSRGFDALNLSL